MPSGSMLKYFDEAGGPDDREHGGRIHWPGTREGFPFRGETIPNLRGSEIDQIQHALDYRSDMFKLWEPDRKKEFDRIMDRIINGWYMQHKRKDVWVEEHQHLCVWLEWVQIYGERVIRKHPGEGEFDGADGGITISRNKPGELRTLGSVL